MPKFKDAKSIVCYGCVVLDRALLRAHLLCLVSPTVEEFHGVPLQISFSHLFVRVKLKGGKFVTHTFQNTSANSETGVTVKTNWTSEAIEEIGIAVEHGLGADGKKLSLKSALRAENKKTDKTGKTNEATRNLKDLRIVLNKRDSHQPEWRIYQAHTDEPLSLDPKEIIEMAEISPGKGKATLKGWIRTNRDGVIVALSDTKIFERLNPVFRFKYRLYKKKTEKYVQTWKQLARLEIGGD